MRLLHTADWHIGKSLYGHPRDSECAAVLDEVVAIAAAERVDAIVVAGDLLDRRLPDMDHLGQCLKTLRQLGELAPVLMVAGNHDDPRLWEHLAPLLRSERVHAVGAMGGELPVFDIPTDRAGVLHAGLVPWLEPSRLGLAAGAERGVALTTYADDVGGLVQMCAEELRRRRQVDGAPAILVGHLMLDQSQVGGGERELSMGIGYCLPTGSVPTNLDYIALGHIHRPQPLPGVNAPGAYAGSPLALDFSEDNHAKSVTVIDLGQPPRRIELSAGRRLVTIEGTIGELVELARVARGGRECWLRCRVHLETPMGDLAREVRAILPDAIRVEPVFGTLDDGSDTATTPADQGDGLMWHYERWYHDRQEPLDARTAEALRQALERAGIDR